MRTKVFGFVRAAGFAAAIALVLLASTEARAGMIGLPCAEPRIFPGAAVNVVVLPYSTALDRGFGTSALGKQLSLLIQMHLLYDLLNYTSVGVIQLVNYERDGSDCDPRTVWSKVIADTGASGILMVWGRVFQDEGEIYVQTYAKFALNNKPEQLTLDLGGVEYTGILSAQEVGFPVRRVSSIDLQHIADDYNRYGAMRSVPDDAQPGEPLSYGIGKCVGCDDPALEDNPRFSYVVVRRSGDWALVRVIESGKEGWLRLGAPFRGRPLNDFLPELTLMKAAVGYLEARQRVIERDPMSLERAVARYAELAGRATPEAEILGWELSGFEWLQTDAVKGNCSKAKTAFERAVGLDPSDADARNLAAISAVCASFNERVPMSESKLADELLSATVADRSRGPSLGNLRRFYEQAQAFADGTASALFPIVDPLNSSYVKAQLDQLNKLQ